MGEPYIDIKATAATESFETKFNVMGLSTERRVEILNEHYKGKLLFSVNSDGTIRLRQILCKVRLLELPNLSYIDLRDVVMIGDGGKFTNPSCVRQIKFGKRTKEITAENLEDFTGLTSAWVWDNTKGIASLHYMIEKTYDPFGNEITDKRKRKNFSLYVRHSNGRPPTLYT